MNKYNQQSYIQEKPKDKDQLKNLEMESTMPQMNQIFKKKALETNKKNLRLKFQKNLLKKLILMKNPQKKEAKMANLKLNQRKKKQRAKQNKKKKKEKIAIKKKK